MEFNYTKVSIEEKRCINRKVHLVYSNRIFKFKNVKIEILRNLIQGVKCAKILFFFLFFVMLKVTFSYDSGITQIIYKDEIRKREFVTMVFYPTILGENDKLEIIGENPIFIGNKFKKNSEIASGEFPLIFFIHGSGGNNTSMGYLAKELTSRGVIVVATNHLSKADGDLPAETISVKPWVQNEDISFLLDSVLKDSRFNKNILQDSIGLIGYSKGRREIKTESIRKILHLET